MKTHMIKTLCKVSKQLMDFTKFTMIYLIKSIGRENSSFKGL